MAGSIGMVADVSSGAIQVGYASLTSLVSVKEIRAEASIQSRPFGVFQLKVEPAPNVFRTRYGRVRVTPLDLDTGATSERQLAQRWEPRSQTLIQVSEMCISLARQLQPGSVLAVS